MPELPLANGIIIDTTTGQAIRPNASPDDVIARNEKKTKEKRDDTIARGRDRTNRSIRKHLIDLPADPKSVTTVGLVWLYYMLGINDAEIAEATGLRVGQVDYIRGMDLFSQIGSLIHTNLNALNSEDVQSRVQALAADALSKLEGMIDDEEVGPATKARVAMNLLDRAGFSPKSIVEHNHRMEGGLTIRHIRDVAAPKDMPTIDIKPVVVEE